MLYTPSHAELAQHPKTRKLARLLGVSIPTALGHLHLLWHFALKYAQDGDLARFEWDDIEAGVMWEGTPDQFVSNCIAVGWLDVNDPNNEEDFGVSIHDWEEHGGKVLWQKENNAERQQRWRDRRKTATRPSPNKPVTVTSPLYNALEENRLEETRGEERREDVAREPLPMARPPSPAPKRADARPTLPSAEQLIADLREWADEKGVADILADEVDRFRDYCLSGKNGKPVTYADYTAACRKWITNPNYGHGARAPALTGPNGSYPTPQPKRTANNIEVLRRAF